MIAARAALAVLAAVGAQTQAPARGCELRGTVVGAEASGLSTASVTVVQGSTMTSAAVDSAGHFHAWVDSGTATLIVRAIGYAMQTHDVSSGGPACREIRFELEPVAARIQSVQVRADRATPPRRGSVRADLSWGSRSINRLRTGPENAGDLYSMALNTPGISAAAGDDPGFSVLGMSADQSQATLDGARLDVDRIPPDAGVLARVSTDEYDVSHGGFSGAELSVLTPPTGGTTVRKIAGSVGMVPGAGADRSIASGVVTGAKGVVAGSLPSRIASYRLSWDGADQSVSRESVDGVGGAVLSDPAARDSLAAILAAARGLGLVGAAPRAPRQTSRMGSAMLRLDAAERARTQVSLSLLANWRHTEGVFAPDLSTASHAGSDGVHATRIQLGAATQFAGGVLNELSLTGASRRRLERANSSLPEVDVRLLRSTYAANTDVHLGGNAALPRDASSTSLEIRDDASRYWGDARHLTKLSLDIARSSSVDAGAGKGTGAFGFADAASFLAGEPDSYFWNSSPRVAAAQNAVGMSLGDDWDVTPSVHFVYGVRGDAEVTLPRAVGLPGPRVESVGLSPRAGFMWVPGRTDAGEAAGSGAIVRGGVGRFRGSVPLGSALQVARSAASQTAIQVVCVGAEVPAPDWSFLAAGGPAPRTCRSAGSGASAAAPDAVRFARGFQPPSAWRASLGSSFTARLRLDMDVVYSLANHQRGQVDRNLAGVAAMTLPDEADRPVLFPASAIVAATGIVAPGAGRADAAVGRQVEIRSDGRARAAQVMLAISPVRQHVVSWQLTYTYQRADEERPTLEFMRSSRSFAGDSVAIAGTWARAQSEMRHQVVASASFDAPTGATVHLGYVGRSGFAYTPMVAGDVDGDAVSGDPAFVFDPRASEDTATANAMARLLANAPRGAARCLRRQLGTVARRNSCLGPWTGDASITVEIPGAMFGRRRLTHVSLYVGNLLAGADAALHGSGRRGWGAGAVPDPVLLRPVGFDPANRRFIYQVNSQFGSRLDQSLAAAGGFSVSVGAQMRLGRTPDEQRLADELSTALTDSAHLGRRLQLAFGHTGVSPAALLLAQSAVPLGGGTREALRTVERRVEAASDSLWSSVARRALARDERRGGRVGEGAADLLPLVRATRDEEFDMLADAASQAEALLTVGERAQLPAAVRSLLDRGTLMRLKRSTARFGRDG